MTDATAPLLSLSLDPRARLVLFDIADDPTYVAMEVQVFDDDQHGRGVLALLARHDATIDVFHQASLRLERGPFSVGRGIGMWREAVIEPSRVDVFDDGIVVDVALDDAAGRRIEVRIDDRDGVRRSHSTLLAPVSSGVEDPHQLLVVLLRDFELVRSGGTVPSLTIGGEPRTITPFPGPEWVHHRRFIRYSGAPVILALNPNRDGVVDAGSLGPIERVVTSSDGASAALRFEPPVPDLRTLRDGEVVAGTWMLDVADEADLFGGTWTAARTGDTVHLAMPVTRPWRPRGLPLSLRLVTTFARVFRDWPMTYAWSADVDLAASPATARSAWVRTSPPDRGNAYGVRAGRGRAAIVIGALGAALVAGVLAAVVALRRGRRGSASGG